MTNATSSANSDGTQESDEVSSDPEALILRAMKSQTAKAEPSKPAPEAEESDETEEEGSVDTDESEEVETEGAEEETEETEESENDGEEDVLSQIDFEALTDDQKREIAQRVGSSAGKELGKLRSQNRAKDEEINSLKAQLEQGLAKVLPTNNPHNDLKTIDELNKRKDDASNSYKYLDNLLVSTDEEFEINGEYIDRKTVKEWRDHFNNQLQTIPEREKAIKALGNISSLKSKELEKAKSEVDFLSDEGSENYKKWKQTLDEPEFALMATAFPELGVKVARLLAHSLAFQSKAAKPKSFKLPLKNKAKVIGDLGGGASNTNPNRNKARQKTNSKIQSGDYDDDDIASLISGAFSR